ncbi:DNA repair protein RadC [Acinetobacter ursingii]|uniref:RadC family protein n=1 Tax=Acinetobacter TaxID=469 RepID=UPI0005C9AE3D|nr:MULTISPECIES: DNA repair protein RadC [Acinetobacter]MDG9948712.1 DNA repair protein RadC [Acinetobacter ursingii]MEC6125425.1 DNA repair protein RadC [Acinetobacter ursingii]RSC23165.1 JAB domain-containing protein [Acinetobacter sp. FDAARGOS_515]BBF76463.1 DNA repair protein RadC [Acinetobacter ursingii]
MNHSIKQSIKAWPQQERPRERLLEQGASSLSDAELLAIFLRSGSRQHSAVELARLLIQHFGGLNPVFDASQEELCQFHGMGATKYSQLMAVKELGRRYLNNHFYRDHLNLDSSQLVLDYLRYELQGETQEVFAVLCLDSQLRKLHFKKLFFGSTNFCSVSIKQTLRYAIQQHASFIVIAHNHPFGEVRPSVEDIEMTQQLKQACECVEIKLIDHIIVAKQATFSFAEQRLLNL